MSFSTNLQHLRATRSMTQEQLAMLLGVSRQAVSKWESDAAYPEMDKLLCLCDIFECSLDELARGDLTHRTREHALAVSPDPRYRHLRLRPPHALAGHPYGLGRGLYIPRHRGVLRHRGHRGLGRRCVSHRVPVCVLCRHASRLRAVRLRL